MGFIDENKWLLASGAALAAFASYCVYFDRKRRSDPDYKKKILMSKSCLDSSTDYRVQYTTNH